MSTVLLALPILSIAQGALGTKKDVALPKSQPLPSGNALGGMQLLQLLIAVGIVVGILKFVLPKVISKMGKGLKTSLGSSIKIEESATFAGGNLFVVSARSRTLLICATPQTVTCLADLTEPEAKQEPKAFFEILDEATPMPKLPETPSQAVVNDRDIQAALSRLARLEG
ncbi:MAG: hypothetical protein K1X67_00805 [Fimbriimonadaceae bacterium]|nr:hypothetical protein [Fimbriimonadaceae bacterium]